MRRSQFAILILFAAAAGMLALRAAPAAHAATGGDPLSPGKQIYEQRCEGCHGKTGRGDGPAARNLERPPGNLADPMIAQMSDEVLGLQILKGKKPMPAFEHTLTAEQIRLLVRYVRTFSANR